MVRNNNIYAVIGANFGDEGKGSTVYYLSSLYKNGAVLNILYNGGMQRGHTVHLGENKHVFHCFGSGTHVGAKTYWAQNFLVDPYAAMYEANILKKDFNIDINIVFAHPNCRIVTPYDIVVNQYTENNRGKLRHGSCGMGIYETIKRNQKIEFTLSDCLDIFSVYGKVQQIKKYYEGIYSKNIFSNISIDKFVCSIIWLMQKVDFRNDPFVINWDAVIFEGGQGLALSCDNLDDYPHLTPSYTGSQEIVKILNGRPITNVYVTRSYITRHGAGPLPNEDNSLVSIVNEDGTNIPNDYQGEIRYAPFDVENIRKRILKDLENYSDLEKPWINLVITQSNNGGVILKNSLGEYINKTIYKDMIGVVDKIFISNINDIGIVEIKQI